MAEGRDWHGARPCRVAWLGLVDYDRAWDLQRALVEQVKAGATPATLLLLEHPHVYTLGRRGQDSDVLAGAATLAALGATVRHVDRGGEVTYHGPGQLVGYTILDLKGWGGPVRYVRALEQALIATLLDFGVRAGRIEGLTGVWVGDEKIAAIGLRVSGGVTSHGFALNVNTDLSYFQHIVPCGIRDRGVTSMARLLGQTLDMAEVRRRLVPRFGAETGLSACEVPLPSVWGTAAAAGETKA